MLGRLHGALREQEHEQGHTHRDSAVQHSRPAPAGILQQTGRAREVYFNLKDMSGHGPVAVGFLRRWLELSAEARRVLFAFRVVSCGLDVRYGERFFYILLE